MKDFKGKVAVVTGGASGIGLSIAKEAAKKGMKIVLADIDLQGLKNAEEFLKSLTEHVVTKFCDVTEFENLTELAEFTIKTFGRVDYLFNNAGISSSCDLLNLPVREFDLCLKTNLYSVFYGCKAFLPYMINQKSGYIANTASLAGIYGTPSMHAYHASKFGVVGLSESLYNWLKMYKLNIGVTILCPGMVKTNINEGDRNRSNNFKIEKDDPYINSDLFKTIKKYQSESVALGIDPDNVVKKLFNAIEKEQLYLVINEIDINRIFDIKEHFIDRASIIAGEKNTKPEWFTGSLRSNSNN